MATMWELLDAGSTAGDTAGEKMENLGGGSGGGETVLLDGVQVKVEYNDHIIELE